MKRIQERELFPTRPHPPLLLFFFPNSLPPPPPTPLYTPNPNGLEETSLLIKENLRALFVKKIYLPNSQTI